MIKRCPTCNRTYSDETISFCLADGALLSAPYDRVDEASPGEDRGAPPTEVLPPPQPPRPTEASAPRTIPAPPPRLPRQTSAPEEPRKSARGLILAALAVVLLGGLLIAGYLVLTRSRNDSELLAETNANVNSNSDPSPTETSTVTPMPSTSPAPTRVSSTPTTTPDIHRPTPTSSASPDTPAIPSPTSTPQAQPDYDRIFSGNEVDKRAVILSLPKPGYTEAARKNQITGTVILRAVLTASGQVTNISVVRGLPDGLSEKAIAAARMMKFEPARKDGRAVSQYQTIQMVFNLY